MRIKFVFIAIVSLLNTLLVTGVTVFDRMHAFTAVQRHPVHPSLFAVGIFLVTFVVITAIFLCEPLFRRQQKA